MAENVSEIMSGLAGIRSGLSVISENTDTINELVQKGDEIKKKIKDRKDEYYRFLDNCEAISDEADNLKREIDEAKYHIQLCEERIAEKEQEIKEAEYNKQPQIIAHNLKKMRKNARRAGRKSVRQAKIPLFPGYSPIKLTAIIMVVVAAISAYAYFVLSDIITADLISLEEETLICILIACNLAYPVGCILVFLVRCCKEYMRGRHVSYQRQLSYVFDAPDQLRNDLKSYRDELAGWKETLDRATLEYNEHLHKLQKRNASEKEQEKHVDAFVDKAKYDISVINDDIKKIRNNSIAIKQALIETYKDLLNPADWQHIDVIMYYIETHRADSIKEALNIIDSKLQFEQLTNVVVSSAQAVCGYIQRGFIKLNDNLTLSHNMIMDKLADIECKVDTNTNLIGSTAQILAKGIDRQVTEARLNNALVKKAHKQVGELLEDMEFTTQVNVTVKV